MELNPVDTTVTNNFVYAESKVTGGLFAEIPIQLSAENMTYRDTINVDAISSSYEDFNDYFKSAEMSMKYKSSIPLALSVIVSFLDDNSTTALETLDPFALDAAPVDATSFTSGSSEGTAKLNLTKSQTDNIYKSTRMVYEVKVNSSENKGVNITADAGMEFILAMKVLFDIKDIGG